MVKQLHTGMTPGAGEIHPQFLKALDDVGLSGLTGLWVGLRVWGASGFENWVVDSHV